MRRRNLRLDADRLAILIDAFDLVLRERLPHGNIGRQPQIDEDLGARCIVVQTVGQPLVEFADLADDRLQNVLGAHGCPRITGRFSVGSPVRRAL